MAAVRKGIAADLPKIMEIATASPAAAQWPPAHYEEILAAETGRNRILLVAEDNNQVHGFVVGHVAAEDWEIENVVVEEPWQGKGLGSQMLCELLDQARKTAQSVFLEVRQSNIAARKLYEKMGFVQVGQRKSYYHNPTEDALILKISF